MRFSRNEIFGCWLFILIGGCAWFGPEAPPEWILAPHSVYPAKQFLTGMGEAKSRAQAERRAYAAVARVFSANVKAQSMDRESYAIQEIRKNESDPARGETRSSYASDDQQSIGECKGIGRLV